jgi:hypothetical protein
MYNEKTNANLIDSSLYCSLLIASTYFDASGTLLVAQCLSHCGTNRKVAGSFPDGVTGIFH